MRELGSEKREWERIEQKREINKYKFEVEKSSSLMVRNSLLLLPRYLYFSLIMQVKFAQTLVENIKNF